jgi:hypothetical protein
VALGKLKKVDLRNYWKDEARDFTPWLAQVENLQMLSDTLDLDIELEDTEVSVGSFKADILATETHGRKIIIENQLDKTDHDHLGKLITYASGTESSIVIWICKSVTEEHRKAIEWLNEISEENVDFFAVEIELWKIDDSSPAPKFNIVCSPNEWAKSVKESARSGHSDIQISRQDLWTGLREYMLKNKTSVKPRKPHVEHWYDFAIGRSGFHLSLTINTQRNTLGCELYLEGDKAKQALHLLSQEKDAIEKEIGHVLEWREQATKTDCRIILYTDGDIRQKEKWDQYYAWFYKETELFYKAFSNRVKQLDLEEGISFA